MVDAREMGQQTGYHSLEWKWPIEAMNMRTPIYTYTYLLLELGCFNLLVNSELVQHQKFFSAFILF